MPLLRRSQFTITLLAAASALFLPTPGRADKEYVVTEIPTFGGNYSVPNAINDSGTVVGYSYTVNQQPHAFMFANGITTDLGTLGGLKSYANDINSIGQIIGGASPVGSTGQHSFLYFNGHWTDLSPSIGLSSFGYRINDAGQITGAFTKPNQASHGFLYSNGVMTDIGTLGGSTSTPADINASGDVVGESLNMYGERHAFLYSHGVMTDLSPTTYSSMTSATGINASGQVVGQIYRTQYGFNPCLWSHGVLTIIRNFGGTNGIATGINDSGVVIGNAQATNYRYHPFRYKDNVLSDLNSLIDPNSGWVIGIPYAINSGGAIAADGMLNGHSTLCLLTPIVSPPDKAPANLIATATSDTKITLSWNEVPTATSYNIYRGATHNGIRSLIGSSTTTSFSNVHLAPSTAYYYVVVPTNSFGTGPISTEATATTQEKSLTVTATAASPTQINLTWNAIPRATSYFIFRGPEHGGFHTYIAATTNPHFSDLGLQAGTRYYYIVVAQRGGPQDLKSLEVNALTTPVPGLKAPVVTATTTTQHTIKLSWPAVSGATSYYVFRSDKARQYHSYLGQTSTTTFNDSTVYYGYQYFYIVIAVNATGQGPKSNEVVGIL